MSLVSMLKPVARRLGISANLTSAASATDPGVITLFEVAQEEGRQLANRHAWTALQSEAVFTTVAAAAQPNAMPADFDRFIDETMFNRTLRRPLDGPISPQEWQELQALTLTRVDPAFRVRGSAILLSPTPLAGQQIAFEYVSKHWCQSSTGTTQAAWQNDSDVGRLDETLMGLGVEWRFRARKGFDHETLLRDYERIVSDAIYRDGGKRTISSDMRGSDFSGARARTWNGRVIPS